MEKRSKKVVLNLASYIIIGLQDPLSFDKTSKIHIAMIASILKQTYFLYVNFAIDPNHEMYRCKF